MSKPEVQWLEDRIFSINGEEFFDYLFCKFDSEGNIYTYHDSYAAEKNDALLDWMGNTVGLDYVGIFPHDGWYLNGQHISGWDLPKDINAAYMNAEAEQWRINEASEQYVSAQAEHWQMNEISTDADWDQYYS